ncbi:MAG: PAS domain S-box protein [Ferruginibacter sp.]
MTAPLIEDLLSEIEELKNRLAEAEQLIEAIKAGEVDAFAFAKADKLEIFTLQSGDYAYRILVENFREGALNLSEDGLIVYTNTYFYEFLGLTYDEVISTSIFDLIHSSSEKGFAELFKKGLAGLSKGEINLYAGGKIVPVYVSLTSLYPTLPTIGMIVTDLTAKKKQENILQQKNAELEKINKELQWGEERYHRMVKEVKDYAILFLSPEGIIKNWNEGARKIKGYDAEEIIGHNFSIFYTRQDKENGLPEKLLAEAKEKGTAHHEGWRVRKDESLFWGSIVITALHDEHNKIIGFSKVTKDLTDKKIADDRIKGFNQELKHKNDELEKMNNELQSFAYISSHDLQEPLRKIQTFATRILEKEEKNLSVYGKDHFKRMQLAANRMQKLIDDLLAYSRTTTEDRVFEKTSLNKIIEDVKEDLKENIEEKKATIETTELGELSIIPFQFHQLIYNIIANSLKYSREVDTPHIKIKGEISTGHSLKNPKLSPRDKYCHISISDNGIGFEQEYNEKIFEVFQRLHGKTEYAGTGIGLAIAKRIVENHNGIITASGEPNKGATFEIYIPITSSSN